MVETMAARQSAGEPGPDQHGACKVQGARLPRHCAAGIS